MASAWSLLLIAYLMVFLYSFLLIKEDVDYFNVIGIGNINNVIYQFSSAAPLSTSYYT